MPQWWRWLGTVVWLKFVRLSIILGTHCWLTNWAILTQWHGMVRFTQKENTTKNLRILHIYTWKCKNNAISHFLTGTPPGRQNVDWASLRFLTLSWSLLLRCDVGTLWRSSICISTRVKLTYNSTFLHRNLRIQSQIVNVSAFSVELILTKPIGDYIHCLLSPGKQSPRKMM